MNVVVWKLRWKFALTTTFASVIDECGKTGSQKLMSHVIQYSVDQTPFSFSFPRQRHWIKRKSWKQFMSLFLCYYFWQNLESLSSHVRESVLRNPGNFCSWRIRNPGIFCLESGIPLKETGIPVNDWIPDSKALTQNPECRGLSTWNRQDQTVLDSLLNVGRFLKRSAVACRKILWDCYQFWVESHNWVKSRILIG